MHNTNNWKWGGGAVSSRPSNRRKAVARYDLRSGDHQERRKPNAPNHELTNDLHFSRQRTGRGNRDVRYCDGNEAALHYCQNDRRRINPVRHNRRHHEWVRSYLRDAGLRRDNNEGEHCSRDHLTLCHAAPARDAALSRSDCASRPAALRAFGPFASLCASAKGVAA